MRGIGDSPFMAPGPAMRPMASARVNSRSLRISLSSSASASERSLLMWPDPPSDTVSPLVLNPVNVALGAGLDIGGVGLVGVDVHGQREVRVHAHQNVAKDQLSIAGNAHAHKRFVAHAVAERVRGRHVDV